MGALCAWVDTPCKATDPYSGCVVTTPFIHKVEDEEIDTEPMT